MNQSKEVIRLPSVQLIGAQKAGTSAIADWLFDECFCRPKVFEDEPWYYSKEVHFFDVDSRFNCGVDFYAKRFHHAKSTNESDASTILTMDATPDTFPFPERVKSIYQAAGGNQVNTVKIIVILRDPVARELSLYNHLVHDCRFLNSLELNNWHKQVLNTDGSIMSFDEFVHNVSLPALGRNDAVDFGSGRSSRHGLYAVHLQKWFDNFDRTQILVLSYDELCNNPRRLQDRIRSFLGRPVAGSLRRSNSNDSLHKVGMPSDDAKQALLLVLEPHNERLYQLLKDYPGPTMEQTPFPHFVSAKQNQAVQEDTSERSPLSPSVSD